jgi:hypothetical protein
VTENEKELIMLLQYLDEEEEIRFEEMMITRNACTDCYIQKRFVFLYREWSIKNEKERA